MIALFKHQYFVVQTSLIGTAFANMTLMIGLSFLFGCHNRDGLSFNVLNVRAQLDVFLLSVCTLFLTQSFHSFSLAGEVGISEVSRASSVLMILGYLCFLFWAFKTHKAMIEAPVLKNKTIAGLRLRKHFKIALRSLGSCIKPRKGLPLFRQTRKSSLNVQDTSIAASVPVSPTSTQSSGGNAPRWGKGSVRLSTVSLVVTLIIGTAFVGVCSTFALDRLDQITDPCAGHLTVNFLGVILLPFLSCNVDAVFLAMEDHLDYSFGITIGTSVQVLAFILPLTVLVGWMHGNDGMTIYVDGFELAILFMTVIMLKTNTQSGTVHWFASVIMYFRPPADLSQVLRLDFTDVLHHHRDRRVVLPNKAWTMRRHLISVVGISGARWAFRFGPAANGPKGPGLLPDWRRSPSEELHAPFSRLVHTWTGLVLAHGHTRMGQSLDLSGPSGLARLLRPVVDMLWLNCSRVFESNLGAFRSRERD
jgi:Ca2+/H+ antiporter